MATINLSTSPCIYQGPYTDDYETYGFIASGSYGRCYKVCSRRTGVWRVAKVIPTEVVDTIQYGDIDNSAMIELFAVANLRHNNIIKCLAAYLEPTQITLIYPYYANTLRKWISTESFPGKHETVKSIMWQLLQALKYIHEHGFLHRDIKPDNILYDDINDIKLIDFGLAKFTNCSRTSTQPFTIQTFWYRAIECFLELPYYGGEVDIWAAGCILVELSTGESPFAGATSFMTIRKIWQWFGTPHAVTCPSLKILPKYEAFGAKYDSSNQTLGSNAAIEQCFKEERSFVMNMLSPDLETRWSAGACLQSVYFKQYYLIGTSPKIDYSQTDIYKTHLSNLYQLRSLCGYPSHFAREKSAERMMIRIFQQALSREAWSSAFIALDLFIRALSHKIPFENDILAAVCLNLGDIYTQGEPRGADELTAVLGIQYENNDFYKCKLVVVEQLGCTLFSNTALFVEALLDYLEYYDNIISIQVFVIAFLCYLDNGMEMILACSASAYDIALDILIICAPPENKWSRDIIALRDSSVTAAQLKSQFLYICRTHSSDVLREIFKKYEIEKLLTKQ